MIRVLAAIVVPPHLTSSGASRAGEQLSAALAPHCDMSVANMAPMSAPEANGGRETRVPVKTRLSGIAGWPGFPTRYRTLFYASDIASHIRSNAYDLVHLHNPLPALEMRRIARACRARSIPYVVSTHGFNEVVNGGRAYGFGRARRVAWQQLVVAPVREVVRNAATIFALSPADVPLVRGLGFEGPISIVTNGVELPAAEEPAGDAEIYRRFGISTREEGPALTCFFLANHTPNKGLPVLLQAFSELNRPFQLILGGEPRSDVPYQQYAEACGPGQQIITTGRLSDEEVGAMFRRADMFIFPTLADTLPLVVLEAMAHGVPVVASSIGGIPYQLSGGAGVLVAPGDSQQLAKAVERLADQPEQRLEMASKAREDVGNRFTWKAAAAEALSSYERIAQQHSKRRSGAASGGVTHLAERELAR